MDLVITAQTARPLVATLRSRLKKAIPLIPHHPTEISIALVNDQMMSLLHERDLGIAGPTDVLTYELDHDPKTERCIAGEVIVCVPEARRQAAARKGSVDAEVLLYALHGVLHLAGFDDRTERCFREMHRMEDDILTKIGIGPVFRRPRSPGKRRARAASKMGAR